MQFLFTDVPDEGLEIEGTLAKHEWVRSFALAEEFPEKFVRFDCSATLYPAEEGLLFRGSFQAECRVPCDRCGDEFQLTIEDPKIECLVMQKAGSHKGGGAASDVTEADGSIHVFTGPHFKVGDVLREYVHLALPLTRVCMEGCKGLCSECGENLNRGHCSCTKVAPKESPFVKLKEVRGLPKGE